MEFIQISKEFPAVLVQAALEAQLSQSLPCDLCDERHQVRDLLLELLELPGYELAVSPRHRSGDRRCRTSELLDLAERVLGKVQIALHGLRRQPLTEQDLLGSRRQGHHASSGERRREVIEQAMFLGYVHRAAAPGGDQPSRQGARSRSSIGREDRAHGRRDVRLRLREGAERMDGPGGHARGREGGQRRGSPAARGMQCDRGLRSFREHRGDFVQSRIGHGDQEQLLARGLEPGHVRCGGSEGRREEASDRRIPAAHLHGPGPRLARPRGQAAADPAGPHEGEPEPAQALGCMLHCGTIVAARTCRKAGRESVATPVVPPGSRGIARPGASPLSTMTDLEKLSQRDLEILESVIRTFVLTGQPVSSRALTKEERYELSAATIRNVMADLEDEGLLDQPHTSAGRVPTRAGYHLYIESLMKAEEVPASQQRYIEDSLLGGSTDAEGLAQAAGSLLSELSDQIGIVMTPAIGETVLRSIELVPLSGQRVLCVLVSTSGFADNKVVETDEPMTREDLTRVSNYLTENFSGMTLRQIRERVIDLMAEERAKMDRLLTNAVAVARQALEDSPRADVVVEGTARLLGAPELRDLERVRRLMDTFADRARLVSVLNRLVEGPGVRVIIGEDSDLTSALDFSLVATTYGVSRTTLGTLGIFGPSRMPYQRVIPLVHYLGWTLGRALEQTIED